VFKFIEVSIEIPDIEVTGIVALMHGGSTAGCFDFPNTRCDMECEQVVLALVGLPEVPRVSVGIVLLPPRNIIDVGRGPYVNDARTSDVVPEGQIGIPEMVQGSVGCGQMSVGCVPVGSRGSGGRGISKREV
jgi:hypothetical protein